MQDQVPSPYNGVKRAPLTYEPVLGSSEGPANKCWFLIPPFLRPGLLDLAWERELSR